MKWLSEMSDDEIKEYVKDVPKLEQNNNTHIYKPMDSSFTKYNNILNGMILIEVYSPIGFIPMWKKEWVYNYNTKASYWKKNRIM